MQQDQLQDEINLQLLEEQEQSIRRLEVCIFSINNTTPEMSVRFCYFVI